jgi:FkbH-like protein
VHEQVIAIAATFTAEPIDDSLAFWIEYLDLPARVQFAPYNQIFQQVLDPASLFARNQRGMNVMLVRPEDWLGRTPSASATTTDLSRFTSSDVARLRQNARDFADGVRSASARWMVPTVVCVCPASRSAIGDAGLSSALDDVEAQLAAALTATTAVHVIRPGDIAMLYPVSQYDDPHSESIGHVPYSPEWFVAVGTTVARKIAALNRPPVKVISLDCDDTLWRGICGEIGPLAVEIDESRKALQRFVLDQQRAGLLVCLCSRNNEEDVFAVFDQRADMLLKREHVLAWRINWRAKSENLRSLAAELQLGLDSFVHFDDDPIACAELRANCPDVLTLQPPNEVEEIRRFLAHVWAFDRLAVTDEDRSRTIFYQEDRRRDEALQQASSFADFIAGLDLAATIAPLAKHELARAAQLTVRTNQFNCTTIRRSEQDLRALLDAGTLEALAVRLSDRFGDYGLVGLMLFRDGEYALEVDTFLLSCRALGRGVEHRMLAELGATANARAQGVINVRFVPTPKNQPALEFLESIDAAVAPSGSDSLVFRVPTARATAVTFTPGGAPPPAPRTSAPPEDMATRRPADAANPATARAVQVQRVATELCTVPQIVLAIQRRRQHARPQLGAQPADPRTPIEQVLVEIWATLLNLDRVGVDDDFGELGGHSLLATVLLSRVRDAFDVDIALYTFYEAPTVAGLAAAIEQAQIDRADEEELARALDEMSQLSDEQVRALLARERV